MSLIVHLGSKDGHRRERTHENKALATKASAANHAIDFSFSIPQMPSAGTIYKLPFAGKTLRKWRSVLVGALSLGLLACGCKGPKPAPRVIPPSAGDET